MSRPRVAGSIHAASFLTALADRGEGTRAGSSFYGDGDDRAESGDRYRLSPERASAEEELLEEWRRGSQAAGRKILEQHIHEVSLFFKRYTWQDAEELVQRTALAWMEADSRRKHVRSAKRYLLGIARKQLLGYLRQKQRSERQRVAAEQRSVADAPVDQFETVQAMERCGRLAKVLDTLPEELQLTVHLRYWEGCLADDIATETGVSTATVRTRLFRARQRLRDCLAREPGGEAGLRLCDAV